MERLETATRRLSEALDRLEKIVALRVDGFDRDRQALKAHLAHAESEQAALSEANKAAADALSDTIDHLRDLLATS